MHLGSKFIFHKNDLETLKAASKGPLDATHDPWMQNSRCLCDPWMRGLTLQCVTRGSWYEPGVYWECKKSMSTTAGLHRPGMKAKSNGDLLFTRALKSLTSRQFYSLNESWLVPPGSRLYRAKARVKIIFPHGDEPSLLLCKS